MDIVELRALKHASAMVNWNNTEIRHVNSSMSFEAVEDQYGSRSVTITSMLWHISESYITIECVYIRDYSRFELSTSSARVESRTWETRGRLFGCRIAFAGLITKTRSVASGGLATHSQTTYAIGCRTQEAEVNMLIMGWEGQTEV